MPRMINPSLHDLLHNSLGTPHPRLRPTDLQPYPFAPVNTVHHYDPSISSPIHRCFTIQATPKSLHFWANEGSWGQERELLNRLVVGQIWAAVTWYVVALCRFAGGLATISWWMDERVREEDGTRGLGGLKDIKLVAPVNREKDL